MKRLEDNKVILRKVKFKLVTGHKVHKDGELQVEARKVQGEKPIKRYESTSSQRGGGKKWERRGKRKEEAGVQT